MPNHIFGTDALGGAVVVGASRRVNVMIAGVPATRRWMNPPGQLKRHPLFFDWLHCEWLCFDDVLRSTGEGGGVFTRRKLQRLTIRGRDNEEVIKQRMNQAVDEISHYAEADYIVVNDVFETALDELQSVIQSQRLRAATQVTRHARLLQDLLS